MKFPGCEPDCPNRMRGRGWLDRLLLKGRRCLSTLIASVAIIISSTATADSKQLLAFQNALATWQSHAIKDYTFTVRHSCYCSHALDYGPIQNIIRKGRLRESIYVGEIRDGWRPNRRVVRDIPLKMTADDLFEDARRVLEFKDSHYGKIEYHARYGVPVAIEWNHSGMDHDWATYVDTFRVN